MSSTDLATAQLHVKALEAEADKHRREDAKAELERLGGVARKLEKETVALIREVKQAESERLSGYYELRKCAEQIRLYSTPLDPELLPTDAQIADNAQQLALWQKHEQEAYEKYQDAVRRESQRLRAGEMDNALISLKYQLRNLQAIVEGRQPGEMKGSLSRVGENFLNVPGFQEGAPGVFVPAATEGKKRLAG